MSRIQTDNIFVNETQASGTVRLQEVEQEKVHKGEFNEEVKK